MIPALEQLDALTEAFQTEATENQRLRYQVIWFADSLTARNAALRSAVRLRFARLISIR